MKFARRTGGTNPLTKRTLSADEVIGEILDCNNVFIPIAVGPFGELGSIFRRFIERNERPNATRAAQRAMLHRTPMYSAKQTLFGEKRMAHNYSEAVTYLRYPASGLTKD
jgi:hypothetical protein